MKNLIMQPLSNLSKIQELGINLLNKYATNWENTNNLILLPSKKFEYSELLEHPEVVAALREINLVDHCYFASLVVLPANDIELVHVDFSNYSLNIPIANYNNTQIKFFKVDTAPISYTLSPEIQINAWQTEDCSELETHEINSAYLFNVTVPYCYVNKNPTPTVILSLGLQSVNNLL